MRHLTPPHLALLLLPFLYPAPAGAALVLNELDYFEQPGLNVMVFDDFYPQGHQGGVAIIQNGIRVATNGDLRLSPDPGQWQPIPRKAGRTVDREAGEIRVELAYPDPEGHLKGFNPLIYPDLDLEYEVAVRTEGGEILVEVDLARPLPDEWAGKAGFNLELVPTVFFGRSYYMDAATGQFPRQANGPVHRDESGRIRIAPLAAGRHLVIAPEDDQRRLSVHSDSGSLLLLDGRATHNNGWFVVREEIAAGAARGAVRWRIRASAIPDWRAPPVIQVSQVGYHSGQPKRAVIELDKRDPLQPEVSLRRIGPDGTEQVVLSAPPRLWGGFLRFQYAVFDFTSVTDPGLYVVEYGDTRTAPVRIADDAYSRHVWQPTMEYFLPVQMCHMRVSEKYRVWHDACHLDDALMAPLNINHFDGYAQGGSTLCDFRPLQHVPGLDAGGWHDAGDYDLRVESQINTVYTLCLAWEEFHPALDQTLVDQQARVVEIHHPDGVPDFLQQIEHGLLTVLGGYEALGRLYRGIITPSLRQYVLLGDAASMSDNRVYDTPGREADLDGVWYTRVANRQSKHYDPHEEEQLYEVIADGLDDRLVFTEENPLRSLDAVAGLAAAGRVLRQHNPSLAARSLAAAQALWELYRDTSGERAVALKTRALVELVKSTADPGYLEYFNTIEPEVIAGFSDCGHAVAMLLPFLDDDAQLARLRAAASMLGGEIEQLKAATPYGVPYEPHIWGAGWLIQRFGMQQYFLHKAWPEIFPRDNILNALNFILGCHPGSNKASFASGVGAESVIVAYGVNRADWSYIPGGVVSGTALIRPDFPELLEFPYLWQQTEYVMGGGATHFMFLAMAADQLLTGRL